MLKDVISTDTPLIGIEPSAILGFRDEIPDLVPDSLIGSAVEIGKHTFLIDEFIAREAERGRILSDAFTQEPRRIKLHGHCHQKAFDVFRPVQTVLGWIPQLDVSVVESSCCGMAGSFGYEAEHYEASKAMAELSLLPAVRRAQDAAIVADATSCRHQIADGADTKALHVAQVLASALKD